MTLGFVALGIALLALIATILQSRREKKLREELDRLKSVEWSYRELRKDMDERIVRTREYLARLSEGRSIPAEAILAGKSLEEIASDEEIRSSILNTIEGSPVTVFMKGTPQQPQCGFSATVVGILDSMKVPYEGINAVEHPKFRGVLSQVSNWPTLPQVFVGGKLIGGCDIVKEMHESGELQQVLDEALQVARTQS